MVQELNNFISMKKERSADLDARRELVAGGSPSKAPQTINGGIAEYLMLLMAREARLPHGGWLVTLSSHVALSTEKSDQFA